jgi:hypothetical protein
MQSCSIAHDECGVDNGDKYGAVDTCNQGNIKKLFSDPSSAGQHLVWWPSLDLSLSICNDWLKIFVSRGGQETLFGRKGIHMKQWKQRGCLGGGWWAASVFCASWVSACLLSSCLMSAASSTTAQVLSHFHQYQGQAGLALVVRKMAITNEVCIFVVA